MSRFVVRIQDEEGERWVGPGAIVDERKDAQSLSRRGAKRVRRATRNLLPDAEVEVVEA